MTVEVLHVRHPDLGCFIRVFIDDVEVGYSIVDVDPGRGFLREDWDSRITGYAEDTTAFGQAAYEALMEESTSPYITDLGPPAGNL